MLGLGFRREAGNILSMDYIGIRFPYSHSQPVSKENFGGARRL